MDSDTIIAIIAIIALNKNLKMKNGLHPNSSAKEILKQYSKEKVRLNLMMSWEKIQDDNAGFNFIFMTEAGNQAGNQVGNYQDLQEVSLAHNLNIKADWITIHN